MKLVTVGTRWILSAAMVYWMWTSAGLAVGVLAALFFAQAELTSVLIKFNNARIDGLENTILSAVQSLREHMQRRETYRRHLH